MAKNPPSPKGMAFLRGLGRSTGERLDAMQFIARTCGDIAYFRFFQKHYYLLNHPDYIRQIMAGNPHDVYNSPISLKQPKLPNPHQAEVERAEHRQTRKLIQPAFTPAGVAPYADLMIGFTSDWLARWPIGETRDLNDELTGLTLAIVAKSLFDADISGQSETISEAVTRGMQLFARQGQLVRVPVWVPSRDNIKLWKAWIDFDKAVKDMVTERHASPEAHNDLLSRLLRATGDDGGKLTEKQAHGLIMGLLIAGHETTSTALSWALYAVLGHPGLAAQLRDEAHGQPLHVDSAFPLTIQVVYESLRLYPPVYAINRHLLNPVEVGGYTLMAGAQAFASPYLMHRDGRFFDDPETFKPERWAGDLEKQLPSFAYFPFGGGPHVCTGQFFAWQELRLLLATIMGQAQFELLPDQKIGFAPVITMRPDKPIQVRRVG